MSGKVYFNNGLQALREVCTGGSYSRVYVLADTNTSVHCLPVFMEMLEGYTDFDLIETDAGEENKTIEYCEGIWSTLMDFGADRKALLLNLGGGVITDIGGFIAATYKRGINFVNIPTSLLAQVDAATGNKTGVDLLNVKNAVGVFATPLMVCIEEVFLKTLPERERLSGFAEMLKHGIIASRAHFTDLVLKGPENITAGDIAESVNIKERITGSDPQEAGPRKVLNFGHTVGHAIETRALAEGQPVTHGEAVARGMYFESLIANETGLLNDSDTETITTAIARFYGRPTEVVDAAGLYKLMHADKKNEGGNIMFSLPEKIGKCHYNVTVEEQTVIQVLNSAR